MAYIVNDSDAQVLISSAAKREVPRSLPPLCPNVRRFLMVDGTVEGWESYEDAVAGYPDTPVDDERLGAAMLYSSGTTGQPKGILRPMPDQAAEPSARGHGVRQGHVRFPRRHDVPVAGAAVPLGAASERGGDAAARFDRRDHGALRPGAIPATRRALPRDELADGADDVLAAAEAARRGEAQYDLSSLEKIVHAAAPCPVPVKEAMIEWWGPIIVEYYGATEAHGFTFCDSEQWLAHKGTVGKCILGKLLILDENGDECPTGTPGTVWFRGATGVRVLQRPDEDRGLATRGRRRRHELGRRRRLRRRGGLPVPHRSATYMIISGGVNIYPQEAENLLISHPKVMDAAVFGVPNDDLGEEVKAVVQVVDGVEAGPALERELIEYCREHLAHYKCPRSVDFEAELPRLPTGKLYKRLLRDRYWKDHESRIL